MLGVPICFYWRWRSPPLVASTILAARDSMRAQVVRLGALSYIVYNVVFFAYGADFNPLFLIYPATLSLAVWSVVAPFQEADA
jgi:hypothetical protein